MKASITRDQVNKAVKGSQVILRECEEEFFEQIKQLPILLFSAGITDIVKAAMVHKATAGFTENMKGISRVLTKFQ